MTQIVVLAGGLATRMLPLTERVPKVLLPVSGRPFLAHLLDRLVRDGARSALLLVGHLAEDVERALETDAFSAHRTALHVHVARDRADLGGTGGALVGALDRLEASFVVTYGDALLSVDYTAPLATLSAAGDAADGCMVVTPARKSPEPPNAALRDDRVVRYQKGTVDPTLDAVDAGALALRRSVVEALAAGVRTPTTLGLEVVQRELASRGRLLALTSPEPSHEIGSREGLMRLETALAQVAPRARSAS